MTYEETKIMLKSLAHKKNLCRVKQRQIAEEQEQISIPAVDYTRVRISGGESVSTAQRYAEHMEKLEAEYSDLLDDVFATEDYLAANLQDLTPIEQTIVIERYMNGKSWRQIEIENHYSVNHPYKIHNKALKKISNSKVDRQ